ncbi:hypothetical protein [Flavobacterium algicola]|uniref:hypothetical protein n=1 Tax=Flavobacterium algicola TaxID=556529 RepID=UPI001EFE1520|nr:hypothetical protein [Flavobacterium algicola]MCG9791758.1 hypothetical protein [Flavobacterium algicola]
MRSIIIVFIFFMSQCYGQSIFENSITDPSPTVYPALFDPFTSGQVVNTNITVSGIGRGTGLNQNSGGDRYNARDWNFTNLDPNDYFEFILTPNTGYKISFTAFTYTGQVSGTGPVNFSFRSSIDNYSTSVGSPTATGTTINLTAAAFQNITTAITFRIYAWGGSNVTGTFSINDFIYTGAVVCNINTPTISTITQPTCATPTGSLSLTNLPTGTYDLYQNNILLASATTGTTKNISNLVPGTYTYYVKNIYCSSNNSATASINSLTTTWNGSSWSNGLPDSDKNIIFSGNYNSAANIESCSCEVSAGTTNIKSGHTLTVQNNIKIASSSNLIFENSASLIQISDGPLTANSGNITYKRLTTAVDKFDFTYWSSPVKNQSLYDVSPLTLYDKFLSFNNGSWQVENSSTIMTSAKGYIIRAPETYLITAPPSVYEALFKGEPNNGIITLPVNGPNLANLIGNPYPSPLSADAFIIKNSGVIEGTLYFWTHNTNPAINVSNPGSGTYAYSSDDYATYNITGGTATQANSATTAGAINTSIPTGEIGAGQSFFTISKNAGTALFENAMRKKSSNLMSNAQFFKNNSSSKTTVSTTKNRIWLNLSNSTGAFKQILIGYLEGATNAYDSLYDGPTFNANAFVNFYSINDNYNYSIQGRALPFDVTDNVPLGYSSTVEGNFIVSIDYADGLLKNQNVYLTDKLTATTQDLRESPYSFSTAAGTFNDRFSVSYNTEKESKMIATEQTNNQVKIVADENNITIQSDTELIREIIVHDITGKLIMFLSNINSIEVALVKPKAKNQMLLFKIKLASGQVVNRKIIN